MSQRRFVLLALCACMLLVLIPTAQASGVRATVPFDFFVGDTQFKAGDYVFEASDNPKALIVSGMGRTETVPLTFDRPVAPMSQDSKLVFMHENGKYILHQVIVRGDGHKHDTSHGSQVTEIIDAH